jgi:hypothetical protein
MKAKRFVRALRTIPRRVWWIVSAPLILVVIFAMDRHTGVTVLMGWVLWRFLGILFRAKWTRRRHSRDWINTQRFEDELPRINPATGTAEPFTDMSDIGY